MLYAVMSDIHANPWALETALSDARDQGAEKFVCLGDVVGYGPDAVGAVKLAREVFDVVLMGNHDAATAGVISSWNFRPEARAGVLRHGRELSGEDLKWLKGLPYVHRTRTFAAAHGSLAYPEEFPYVVDVATAVEAFGAMGALQLLFVGHTHAAMWIAMENGKGGVANRTLSLSLRTDCRYIVNVGSVGYPRNEQRIVYVLYDSRRKTVTWRRLPFDYARYLAEMDAKKIFVAPWIRGDAKKA